MSGPLDHSPADIIRYLLIQLGAGTLPTDSDDWPIYAFNIPDEPDNCITLNDTAGKLQGRTQTDGETQKFHGIQILVRAEKETTGFVKINALEETLDKSVLRSTITIGSTTYTVYSVNLTTDVISIGKEVPQSKRSLFSINAIVSLRKV